MKLFIEIEVNVEYQEHKERAETSTEPAEKWEIEIESVSLGGIDITQHVDISAIRDSIIAELRE